jgi:hypothetical protein
MYVPEKYASRSPWRALGMDAPASADVLEFLEGTDIPAFLDR